METSPDGPSDSNGTPDAPAHSDDGSSDSSSNAEDDEWKPCRRKVVRRVNLVRSQATKLMWQRKKAAALMLKQQQQREQALPLGGGASSEPSSADASGQDGSSPLQPARSSPALASPSASAAPSDAGPSTSASSSSSAAVPASGTPSRRPLQQPLQPPKKRRLQGKAPGPRRFSMCWADTTLGSSRAGKPSPGKPSPDKPSPDKPSPAKPSTDKPGPDKVSHEKILHEKLATEKLPPDKHLPNKHSPEKHLPEKLLPEKPVIEKLQPEKPPSNISPCKPLLDNILSYKPSPYKPSPYKPSPFRASPYSTPPHKASPYKASPYKTPPHKPSPFKLWQNKVLPSKPTPDKPSNALPKVPKTSPASLFAPNLHDYASRPSTNMEEEEREMAPSQTPVCEVSTTRPSLERACRPKMSLKEDESSSSEYSDDGDGTPRKYAQLIPFRRPQLRPRLLQTFKTEPESDDDDQLRTCELEAEEGERDELEIMPRLVHQGNYVTDGEMPPPGEKYGPPIVTPIFRISSRLPSVTYGKMKPMTAASRRKSLAAKLRWERRRALQQQEQLLADSMSDDPQSSTASSPVCVLPAKLRWKGDNRSAVPPERSERSFLNSLPPKLRFKKSHSVFSMFKRDGTAGGSGSSSSAANGLLTSIKTEPDDGRCTLRAPLAVTTAKTDPKEAPSERRSRAKRLWWEQIKQLNVKLASNGSCALPEGSVEDLLNTLPKFLLEELFADKPSSTRKKKTPASSPVDGSARLPGAPSRRSLIMKENWRKRKQAWLMAAAQSLAAASSSQAGGSSAGAGSSTPGASSSAEQPSEQSQPQLCEDSGPAEGGRPYLERTLALQRCRQYRHGLIAQGDLQQRGRTSRHYNAKGIHISSNKDACDCLQADCPGCHFPCAKCGSTKCGVECRCNRNWVYEQLEIDGVPDTVYQNPLLN
ncbi:uncharacterized protein LOC144169426 isoform X2 [Haemaphysalis longicornis]